MSRQRDEGAAREFQSAQPQREALDRPDEPVSLRLVGSVAAGARLTDAFEEEGLLVEWTTGGVEPSDARPDGKFEFEFIVSTPIDERTGRSRRIHSSATIEHILRRFEQLHPGAHTSLER